MKIHKKDTRQAVRKPETKKFKVQWIINAVRLGKTSKRTLSLGFCAKTKKLAYVSIIDSKRMTIEGLKPLIVRDVYVSETECEDAKFCWNLECPLNNATPQTLKKYLGKCTQKEFEHVSKKLQEFAEHFVKDINWNEDQQIFFEKPPLVIERVKK